MKVEYRGGHTTKKELDQRLSTRCIEFEPGCVDCQAVLLWQMERYLHWRARNERFEIDLDEARMKGTAT